MNLLELQGIVATCLIENPEHKTAYNNVGKLIDRFGIFRTVDDDIIKLIYRCELKERQNEICCE